MGDPLNRRQHHYVDRAVEAFETIADALKRIADRLEASSGTNGESDTATDTETETKTDAPRTGIEPSGRYEEFAIEGVPAQSVAIDYSRDPPELLVHAESVRHPTPADEEYPTHILELPEGEKEER